MLWITLTLALASAGCASSRAVRKALVTPYHPSNVYCFEARLPQELRRVAVLPVTGDVHSTTTEAGMAVLAPVLGNELSKQKIFDLVFVSSEQLQSWTGDKAWNDSDALPTDLLKTVRDKVGCDAILFARLTVYRPYTPLAVGWSIKLVDCQKRRVWWAVDEVFDAGSLPVLAAAESYGRSELILPEPLLEDSAMMHSPQRFGQYTVHAVLATLPPR